MHYENKTHQHKILFDITVHDLFSFNGKSSYYKKIEELHFLYKESKHFLNILF